MKRKIGHGILMFMPLIVAIIVITIASIIGGVVLGFSLMSQGGVTMDPDELVGSLGQAILESALWINIFGQILNLVIFFFWYRATGHRKIVAGTKKMKPVNIGMLVLLALGMQMLINVVMSLVAVVAPDIMQSYAELIESSGLTETTAASIISAVIMAPMMEELVFRGATLFHARKTGMPFWAANIIQAALFGVMHMNLVQGCYAFVLGLFLGWVYNRYQTIWMPIFLHFAFNGLNYVLSTLLEGVNESLGLYIVFTVVGVVGMIGVFFLVKKENATMKVEQEEKLPVAEAV